jgi:hypothetical protein
MGSTDTRDTNGEQEVERYREAAYAALDQLEWTIRVLHRIRKSGIADALEKNRKTIVKLHGL